MEDRAKERATIAKKLKDWLHAELTERVLARLGRRLVGIQEITEDVLVELGRQTDETSEAMRTALMMQMRRQHGAILEAMKHVELDCRYGVGTAEQLYEEAVEVANMSAAETEALKALLKERAEAAAGGGGPMGSRGRGATSAWQWHGWQ